MNTFCVFSPDAYRFTQTERFDAVYGGAEANVAAALFGFGESIAYITKLPAHAIGDAAESKAVMAARSGDGTVRMTR